MIKAQRDLRLSPWNKFFFLFIPRRYFFSGSETKQQCLIRQWDGSAPFHSERPEVRNGREAASLHIGRDTPLTREIDEFLVFRRKVGKRSFVCRPNDRYHDSVLGFNRDADVDGVGLHNAVAD